MTNHIRLLFSIDDIWLKMIGRIGARNFSFGQFLVLIRHLIPILFQKKIQKEKIRHKKFAFEWRAPKCSDETIDDLPFLMMIVMMTRLFAQFERLECVARRRALIVRHLFAHVVCRVQVLEHELVLHRFATIRRFRFGVTSIHWTFFLVIICRNNWKLRSTVKNLRWLIRSLTIMIVSGFARCMMRMARRMSFARFMLVISMSIVRQRHDGPSTKADHGQQHDPFHFDINRQSEVFEYAKYELRVQIRK